MVALGLVAMAGFVACGGDSSTPAGSSASTPAGAGVLTISGSTFSPGSVTTGTGGVLTITNEDSFAHTFTMDDGSVDQQIGGGETAEVTVTAAGPFHCTIHPSMTGTVALG
jgi:plastocyanin